MRHSAHTDASAPDFRCVGIFGAGLIGGSLAKGVRAVRPCVRIVVADTDPTTREAALAEGVADAAADPAATPPREAFAGCDLLLLAAPPRAIVRTLPQLADADIGLVVDTASVKGPIVEAAEAAGLANFLGGHPMAGSEAGGWAAADPAIFCGAAFIVCEPSVCAVPDTMKEAFRALLGDLGFRLFDMDAAAHDRRIALVSHVPHAVAFALAATAAGADDPVVAEIAGGGFRDTTRIAGSSPELWTDILRESPALPAALDECIETLRRLRSSLEPETPPETLAALLRRASGYRRSLPAREMPE